MEEIRVAIPGAEVLFAFLLGVAFTSRFAEVTDLQRTVFRATRLAVASLVMILVSIAGVVFLVADLLHSTLSAAIGSLVTGSWFGWFWFLLPRRATRGQTT